MYITLCTLVILKIVWFVMKNLHTSIASVIETVLVCHSLSCDSLVVS